MKSAARGPDSGSGIATTVVVRSAFFAALVVGLLAVVTAMLAQAAHAEIDETLLDIGSDLMRFPGSQPGKVRDLRVNGARVSLRAESVDAPLDQVLSHYERACAEGHARVFRAVGEAIGGPVGRAAPALGVLATSSGRSSNRGYVACADFGAASDLQSVLHQLLGVSRSGDLDGIGTLRYTYVEADDSSGEERSFVLAIWASSSALVQKLVPMEGRDAEGRDLEGLPRPKDMQRLLSAWEVGSPSGLFSYVTDAHSPEELEAFYRAVLPIHGWRILHRYPGESTQIDRIRMLSAESRGNLITVLAHPAEHARTTLTILASEEP